MSDFEAGQSGLQLMDRRAFLWGASVGLGCMSGASQANRWPTQGRSGPMGRPLVIAHRGASGDRPEHTLSAYRLAISQGADFIEPDLVSSKDGVLVCRHENEISETTDVATRPEFAGRKRQKTIDGESFTGWFCEDFTLAELKTLGCVERLPKLRPENLAYNGREAIPTFAEVVALAQSESIRLGRTIGVYPETKHPSYHRDLGLALEPALLAVLRAADWDRRDAPVFIQSFETANLKALRSETSVRLVQLAATEGGPFDTRQTGTSYRALLAGDGLRAIAAYADGLGPQKTLITPLDTQGRSMTPTDLIDRAHASGLAVHPWTFRAENHFLPVEWRRGEAAHAHGDLLAELMLFRRLGVDGWFCDHPGIAARARDMES